MNRYLKENGLSLFLIFITLLTLAGQVAVGWTNFNQELTDYDRPPVPLADYLISGHCLEAIFENWESEFLQMGLYVLITVKLYQKGSAESKTLSEPEAVDRAPDPQRKGAPWPVRKGGIALLLYRNSLSIAYFLLFTGAFLLHAMGGMKQYNTEQLLKGKTSQLTFAEFLGTNEFWFQSLQNWQSEFLSVLSIVVLTIYLRQQGSPESKPVDAPHTETGK